jgi:hypothetical protein
MGAFRIPHPTTSLEITKYYSIKDIRSSVDLQNILDLGWISLEDENSITISGTISITLGSVTEYEKNEPKWNANKIIDVEVDDTNKGATSSQFIGYNTTSSKLEYKTLNYIHYQPSTASVWTINHNLNRFPSVTVVDSAGSVIEGAIQYDSNNSITLTFSLPFSGKVYLT